MRWTPAEIAILKKGIKLHCSAAEIAEALGRPISTVRARMRPPAVPKPKADVIHVPVVAAIQPQAPVGRSRSHDGDSQTVWQIYRASSSPTARALLMEIYQPLVRKIATAIAVRIPPSCIVDADDLTAEGTIGLAQAIDRFDESRGLQFGTFATPRIHGAIRDALRDVDHLTRSQRNHVKAGDFEDPIRVSLDAQRPDFDDVMGVSVPCVADADPAVRLDSLDTLREVTNGLNKTARIIVILYHYIGLTMKEIGQHVGLSESRVSQLHSRFLERSGQRLRREAV